MRKNPAGRFAWALGWLASLFFAELAIAGEATLSDAQLADKAQRFQSLIEDKLVQHHGMIPMLVRASDYQLPTAEDYQGAYRHRHMRGKTEEEVGIPPMHVRTGRSALFAMGCVAAQRWYPDEDMKGMARKILVGLDEPTFRFIMPFDDKHPLPPEWEVESKMLDADCLTGWLVAYWEGRYRGYW